jgi:lysophospholipase L1-like esterase
MRRIGYAAICWQVVAACVMAGTSRPHICDFNGPDGDGRRRDEMAVYNPQTGYWYALSPQGNVVTAGSQWGWNEADPVPGDYDGDGHSDLAVFQRTRGDWFAASLATSSQILWKANWGWNETVPVPGDYDGDGKADMAVYHRATGRWFIKSSAGPVLVNGDRWGWEYAWPVPGDYNGDGRADMAIYHRPSGTWYIRSVAGAVIEYGVNWGWKEAWPVSGDFNGDRKSDLAVYSRATGAWFIRGTNGTAIIYGDRWGWDEATPVALDYDGDGATDLGVYHRKTGNWYIRSVAGSTLAFALNWGWDETVPLQTYACPASEAMTFVAFGDSITYGDASASEGPATAYPALLEHKLREHFGGWFYMINAGKSGETTWDGKDRLADVLDAHKPDALLLMEGTNDALYDYMFKGTAGDLHMMLNLAISRGIQVVMASIPPVITTDEIDRSVQMARISAFNPTIYSIADTYGFRLAEVFIAITDVPGWENSLMDHASANHPNDAGYLRVRDAFYEQVSGGLLDGDLY